jgi:hypothetical protein
VKTFERTRPVGANRELKSRFLGPPKLHGGCSGSGLNILYVLEIIVFLSSTCGVKRAPSFAVDREESARLEATDPFPLNANNKSQIIQDLRKTVREPLFVSPNRVAIKASL